MLFSGKTAIITGATSGIGLELSKAFAAARGNVVMVGRNEEKLKALTAEINAKQEGRALDAPCDVRDYAQVCQVCAAAAETFGTIDLVVNLAGGSAFRIFNVPSDMEFPDIPMEIYDWGIDVNLKGQLYFAHAAMKYMREQKQGLIVNIGSITGEEGSLKAMDYAAAKSGAMNGLTKSIARYGANYNVRCVCVSPGPVLTRPGMAAMQTLLGRAAEPREIVDLILFLASEKGQFINGTNIMIDGGRNAMGRG